MSPEFAAAVCEGFYGTLEELLSRDLPPSAHKILSDLQRETESAIETLSKEQLESTCAD
jgi:hypothetical protein